jgi:excisionase family DNA binding protein
METVMFPEKVFTIEEISQHLRVPEDAVLQEVTAGRLRALRVGGHVRIRESDFNSYLNASLEAPDADEVTSAAPANATKKQHLFELSPAPSFDHTWPAKKGAVKTTEHFTNAWEGIVSDGGRERHVKIGFTLRTSAGKRRLRCLILVDRYPTVEFVAADEKAKGKMASIIRGRNGKQLPIGATLPPEYKNLPIGSYNEVVQGPRASNGVAVLCDSQDFATMVKHALIRYKFREGRASVGKERA